MREPRLTLSMLVASLGTVLALVASSMQPKGGPPQAHGIQVSSADTAFLPVAAGWNLISLPLDVPDADKSTLFPTAISGAFSYHNGYKEQSALSYGSGYWLKFAADETIMVSGTLPCMEEVYVSPKWNIMGAMNAPIAVKDLVVDPADNIISDYFGFRADNGYTQRDTLRPGEAYWVKARSAGALATTSWEYIGLSSQEIYALAAVDGDTVYVGTHFGILKTTDGGMFWDTLIIGISFSDIKLHPSNPLILYAGIGGSVDPPYGVLKTTNGGTDWFFADSGIYVDWETSVQVLEFDPVYPETLYCGTAGFNGGGIYKTTNGGMSWSSHATNDTLRDGVISIAIHPETTAIVYASYLGLQKSLDGGITWSAPGVGGFYLIRSLQLDPQNQQTVYFVSGAVYKTTNAGASWVDASSGLPQTPAAEIAISRSYRGVYVALFGSEGGVFQSCRQGTEWHRTPGLTVGGHYNHLILSWDQKYLFVYAYNQGIFRRNTK